MNPRLRGSHRKKKQSQRYLLSWMHPTMDASTTKTKV